VYGHALWESVYRILAYWDRFGSFDGVDQILAPRLTQRLLKRFDPAILSEAAPKFVRREEMRSRMLCDTVVTAPLPVCGRAIGAEQIALLEKYALIDGHAKADTTIGTRQSRILLLRSAVGMRSVRNPEEVAETARRAGYAVVDATATSDIFGVFRNAESVVGVHGSDLADVIFMRRGAHVLELTPTDHVHAYFRMAGRVKGLRYDTLFCASESNRLRAIGPSKAGVIVDCAALTTALRAAVDGARPDAENEVRKTAC
jgi:hypothetical protein